MSKTVEVQCFRQFRILQNWSKVASKYVSGLDRSPLASTEDQIELLPVCTLLQSFFALHSFMLSQEAEVDLRNRDAAPASRRFRLNEPKLI